MGWILKRCRENSSIFFLKPHFIAGTGKRWRYKAEVWVEAITEGGQRFMAAWREEEEDATRHRQGKREAMRLGKLLSHTEA